MRLPGDVLLRSFAGFVGGGGLGLALCLAIGCSRTGTGAAEQGPSEADDSRDSKRRQTDAAAREPGDGGSHDRATGDGTSPDDPGRDAATDTVDPRLDSADLDTSRLDDDGRTEACLEYGVAQIRRVDECSGHVPRAARELAMKRLAECPDLFFADGATRSADDLVACAEAWREFPCEDLARGFSPPCVTPGTRAPGEPCLFSSQCKSNYCAFEASGGCSVCVTRVPEGQSCDDLERLCEPGYSCDKVCAELTLPEPEPAAGGKATGETCDDAEECSGDDLCLFDPEAIRRCTSRVAPGDGCTLPNQYCPTDAYCDLDGICRALPDVGDACGTDEVRRPVCAADATCDESGDDPPRCVRRPGPDDACEAGGQACPDGAVCCSERTCAERNCFVVALPGEACPPAPDDCHPGARCVEGRCEAIASQGLFEAACEDDD